MGWLTFAVGGGLIAVPIIIHLFNRTRYRRIDWAAMEFLLNAYRKTRKRVQMENLLLLLLRVLAMLFLAFAFFPQGVASAAKWLLDATGISLTQGADAGRARHLVLVLDDTASMRFRDGARSCFERATEAATEIVNRLRPGRDRVTLIRVAAVAAPAQDTHSEQERIERLNRDVPVLDARDAAEHIAQAPAGYGSGDILAALREAGRRLSSMDAARELPMLTVISDFQAGAWAFVQRENPRHEAYGELLKEIDAVLRPNASVPAFLDVGAVVTKNYGVTAAALEEELIGVGIRGRIRVSVGNFGSGDSLPVDVRLQYRIDQGEAHPFAEMVRVPAGEIATVSQNIEPFETAGAHTIRVEVVDGDASLDDDNIRTIALNVVEDVPVLIVNGAPHEEPQFDEAHYLRLALELTRGEGNDAARRTPNRVSVVQPGALSTTKPGDYQAVLLCNVGSFPQSFVDALEEYVSNGGSLLFSMGENVNIDEYNSLFWKDGQGLLPARLEKIEGALTADSKDRKYVTIKGTDLGPGSPMRLFGESEKDMRLLEGPEAVATWIAASTPQALKLDPERVQPARVALSLNTDGAPPLLIERSYGRGRTLLWTTSVGGRGSWTALWHFGLPIWLFHDTVRHMSVSDASARNVLVGDHFIRILREEEQTGRGNAVETPRNVVERPIEANLPDGRRRLTFTRTAQPGVYKLRFLGAGTGGEEIVAREEVFAVNIAGAESDVTRLGGSAKEKADVSKAVKDSLPPGISLSFQARSDDKDDQASKTPADRMDVWLLFIGLSGLCLLAEMGASVWFSRRAE